MNNNARFSGVFTVEELRRIYKATGTAQLRAAATVSRHHHRHTCQYG
jgi:hypothetical protein